eukprot:4228825-Prymnesium_polylepis.1
MRSATRTTTTTTTRRTTTRTTRVTTRGTTRVTTRRRRWRTRRTRTRRMRTRRTTRRWRRRRWTRRRRRWWRSRRWTRRKRWRRRPRRRRVCWRRAPSAARARTRQRAAATATAARRVAARRARTAARLRRTCSHEPARVCTSTEEAGHEQHIWLLSEEGQREGIGPELEIASEDVLDLRVCICIATRVADGGYSESAYRLCLCAVVPASLPARSAKLKALAGVQQRPSQNSVSYPYQTPKYSIQYR